MIYQMTTDMLPNEDIDRLGEMFFRELRLPGEFVSEVFNTTWKQLFRMQMGTIFAVDVEDQIVGVLGMMIHPDACDGQVVAQEAFWFMDPGFRGGFNAVRLVEAAHTWAKQHGARRMAMASILGPGCDKLRKFYTRLGFRPVEVNYYRDI